MRSARQFGAGNQAVEWLFKLLPVAAALFLAALDRHQASGGTDWSGFLSQFAGIAVAGLPLGAAHLFATRSHALPAAVVWLAAFIAYPLIALSLGNSAFPLAARHFMIAAAFSAASLLAGSRKGGVVSLLHRLPLQLDAVAITLLAIWTLAATSLFGSTPDAVNNQPLRVWFDADRLFAYPLEFTSYLAQFVVVAVLLFGYYWICRYILIRRVLRAHGWIAAGFASLVFWIVYTPLACSMALLLPLNPPDWSLLPSENHNPFDPQNYGLSLIVWSAVMPVLLAGERLLAERRDALGRHERVRAELDALQQQINPHFLFNSLNTVYALCLKDSAASADAVVKLSDLLRYAVYRGQDDWVGLDEEIAYIGNYIDLQQLRFGTRCVVTCNWPKQAEQHCIPPMLLIMLVENAFKHGVEPLDRTVDVNLELMLTGSHLRFTCTNTPLPAEPGATKAGLGLTNLRRRLELLFEDRFALSSAPEGNAWIARLECDLRPC